MKRLTVAIVGRPNVGKSTIFNRLAGERISIVEDTPGVTRDRIYTRAEWLGQEINVIDTGGIDFSNETFQDSIRIQAEIAMDEADVIIMLTNVRDGVTETDEMLARLLHRTNKPVILAVNKVDNIEQRSLIYEFYALGFGDPMPLSGAHGLGLGELLEKVVAVGPEMTSVQQEEDTIRFAIIGRPNVGKSSLVNALLGEERVIVSGIAGTTRDAVDTDFTYDGQKYCVVDTAGLRRRGKVYEMTEKYSVMRSMQAIEDADVTLIVINAEEGIRDQDKNIAGFAHEAGRGIVIVVNKWDALTKDNHTMKKFEEDIRAHFKFIDYAPIVFVSAKTRQRLGQIPEIIKQVNENHKRRIQSSLLNDVLNRAITINPAPSDKGRKLRVYYLTQVSTAPPTFIVFVNDIELMHFTYERFLINQIRESFDFMGTPIKLIVRERN